VRLLSSKYNASDSSLFQTYTITSPTDSMVKATWKMEFYDRMKDIDLTLSKELDSMTGFKLQKAICSLTEQKEPGTGRKLAPYESYFSLREVNIADIKKPLSYFQRFESMYK
jgi:hypothetical protein